MSKRIVIALGGNALGKTAQEQLRLVTETARPIVDLIEAGNEVVVAHGNGPQVGMINLGLSTAAESGAIQGDMPFPECGAMSQGYIGYHLQNAIGNELAARGISKGVATVVTQTLVSEDDPAFQHPTKPVGAFYDKETAQRIAAQRGYTMVEDAGRGYRQVVPSPKPVDIVEKSAIQALFDSGNIVIAAGGGGIPVVRRDGRLYGTPAVIDKDFGSAKLAELLDADMLIILTAVEKVAINFGKPDQKGLDDLTPAMAREYIAQGQFAPGSMLPKVEAALSFAESKPGRTALITLLEKARDGIEGNRFEILRLLAAQEPSLDGLTDRLAYLRDLVTQPPAAPDAGVLLSTVHSSKGLEYDTVYLLDVLDGILPAADPKEPEDQKLYQEERRIFYVAMTRAKDHLFLFSCLDRESSFIRELQKDLPVETSEADDVFGSVEIDPCGKPYHHARKGRGTVLACCRGRCLVEYSGGEMQLLTVGEMYDQRRLLQRLPEKPAARKEGVSAAGAIAGRSVVHTVFGPGRITAYKDPVVTIRFPKVGEKHFILSESIKRGLLRYEDGVTG